MAPKVVASRTESELRESAARERAAVQSRTTDGQLDRQVWGATIKEVGLGYLDGPMELSDVPNDWLLSPRFGIMQGPKMRCVDDFSRLGCNACSQTLESPRLHNLDFVAGMCKAAMSGTGCCALPVLGSPLQALRDAVSPILYS